MKKRLFKVIVAVVAVVSLSSCTGITYHELYKSVSASEVKLEKANFNVSTITKARTYLGGVYAKITYIAHGVVIEFTE